MIPSSSRATRCPASDVPATSPRHLRVQSSISQPFLAMEALDPFVFHRTPYQRTQHVALAISEPATLLSQYGMPLGLRQVQSAERRLPIVERCEAHPVPPAHTRQRNTCFQLSQDRDDMLFSGRRPLHTTVPPVGRT